MSECIRVKGEQRGRPSLPILLVLLCAACMAVQPMHLCIDTPYRGRVQYIPIHDTPHTQRSSFLGQQTQPHPRASKKKRRNVEETERGETRGARGRTMKRRRGWRSGRTRCCHSRAQRHAREEDPHRCGQKLAPCRLVATHTIHSRSRESPHSTSGFVLTIAKVHQHSSTEPNPALPAQP